MATDGPEEWIVATEGAKTLPVQELLTGRGFVSGKSGSGKSNTVSVICEELLEANFTLLIIDTEGEYFGLKEQYQLLHVGGDDFAEVQVGPEHADKIAELSLEKNVPVILDVSGYDDTDTSEELITRVIDELYSREKRLRKPFLLVVEEMQEYLPQQGGSGELADLLERVAKRGRKRGLGMCGVSQRPSSVDKDYITQCDWMAWHKFTWESDLKVVSNVIGTERAAECESFSPGEAYLMTDWDDTIERVQFRRKRTFDAGATPGLEAYERPDLKKVGQQFISEIRDGDSPVDGESSVYTEATVSGTARAAADQPADPDALSDVEPTDSDALADVGSAEANALADATSVDSDLTSADTDAKAADPGAHTDPGGSDTVGGTVPTDPSDDFPALDDPSRVGEDDVEALDDEEVADHVKRVKRENLILKDEIAELREISGTDPEDPSSPFTDAPPPAFRDPSTPARGYGAGFDDRPSDTVGIEPPTRPTAPARQNVENDAAGALFEFGDLMTYLWKLSIYYVLYAVYRVRTWLRTGRGR